MRIIICDDDEYTITKLKNILISYFNSSSLDIPKFATYTCGEDLLSDTGSKDIVFLDIELPGVSGIYVGNELKKQNDKIIIFIVTCHLQFLDDAMRFNVFRYIDKPLEENRIFRNMNDAIKLYNTISIKIPIETKDEIFIIPATDIISVEANNHTITVHTLHQDYTSIHNMNYWNKILDYPCFFVSHKSFIVNLQHVSDFDHSLIHLCNDKLTAYLTRRKYKDFKTALLSYLTSTM